MEHKIIFAGQVGSGKTTAIAAVSDIDIVNTDAKASDQATILKQNTTVAMDYGIIKLADGSRVHLYGTPGQERFRFMWDILTRGGLGLIILIDNSRPDPVQDLAFYLKAFESFIRDNAVAVGITRMDVKSTPTLEAHQNVLDAMGIQAPLMEVDARSASDVKILLQCLLQMLQFSA
ncbi:GTP-binding protein [Proteobacteria bacterium 005FR1]|nr:GTP-binding protein [Proteobacteria bacterium 005FR1]